MKLKKNIFIYDLCINNFHILNIYEYKQAFYNDFIFELIVQGSVLYKRKSLGGIFE